MSVNPFCQRNLKAAGLMYLIIMIEKPTHWLVPIWVYSNAGVMKVEAARPGDTFLQGGRRAGGLGVASCSPYLALHHLNQPPMLEEQSLILSQTSTPPQSAIGREASHKYASGAFARC